MAKKKKKSKQNKLPGAGAVGGFGFSGADARHAGTTLVGVLIAEIIEAAAERLISKLGGSTSTGSKARGAHKASTAQTSTAQAAEHREADVNVSGDGDRNILDDEVLLNESTISDVNPIVQGTVNAVRYSMAELMPDLPTVVNRLKNVTPGVVHRSADALSATTNVVGNTTEMAVEGVVDTTKNIFDAITPNVSEAPGDAEVNGAIAADNQDKRKKKKGKKKKK